MTITLSTKSQIQQSANSYVLANSPLTDVRQSGNLNALTGAHAYTLADFYRDMYIGFLQSAMQGAFNVFDFNALPGNYASTTLTVTVTQATTIPQGFVVSTVGNATNPAVLFQSTSTVQATGVGTISVPVQAVNAGLSGNVAADAITNIITSTPGVVAITNATASTGGTNPETLSQQLNRFQTYVQNLAGAKASAIAYAASQVSGVIQAAGYAPPYLTGIQDNNGVYTDESQAMNQPKGAPFSPFVASPTVDDAFYIGASGPFDGFYIDVATAGSGLTASWQYYGANGWTTLTPTTDLSSNGQQSGSVNFSVPSDWTATSINASTNAYFVRLLLTSTAYTTMPQWYSVYTNNPPPGYIDIYVAVNSAATNVLQNVQTACDAIRAAGDTILINTATELTQNITMTVIPTAAGASQDLSTLVSNSLTQLFAGLKIGQSLPISDITYAVTGLGAGTYVADVIVTTPTNSVTVAPGDLLTAGTFTITIGAVPS